MQKILEDLAKELEELKRTRERLQKEEETERFEPVSYRDIQRIIRDLEMVLSQASPSEAKKLLRLVIKRIDVHSPEFIEQPYYRIPTVRVKSGLAPPIGHIQNSPLG